MDSDSDWDSLTADGPAIGEPSIIESVAQRSVKDPSSPRPPTYDKVVHSHPKNAIVSSPGNRSQPQSEGKASVNGSVANISIASPYKKGQRIAENYRTGKAQAVTVFRDKGDTGDKSDADVTKVAKSKNKFDEIVLADRSEYEMRKPDPPQQSKLQEPRNLPYTNFEVGHDNNQNQMQTQQASYRKRAKTEYVKRTPEPTADTPNQKSSRDYLDARPLSVEEESVVNRSYHVVQPSYQTKDTSFKPSPPKSTNKKTRKLNELGLRNRGADLITDEESDSTDHDVSWDNAGNSVKANNDEKIEYRKGQKKILNNERIYYEKTNNTYHTLHIQSDAVLPRIAEKTQDYIQRGWQEFFGGLQIIVDFFVIFIVEFFKFFARQFVKKLVGGILEGFSDFFLKPLLAVLYNGVFQPIFTFVWNVFNGFRNLLRPFLLVTHEFFSQIAMVLKAIRLVEINSNGTGKAVQSV